MWRSLWRSIDRFSLQYFKYVINELREIKVVDKHNRELVIDLLQAIVEIVTYGDRQDPMIFECFMEYQGLAEFVRVLKINRNSRIEAPLLQYLSIMIQNMESEQAIYYCFSNDYVNSIITHRYNFDGGDLAPYYISFLRAVSGKLNRDTLCLLVKVHGDVVVSFPLYSEALKFAQHGEKMIQTAVRALALNIYNVSDDMVYQYITTPPVSKYFSNLVHGLREQCVLLDACVHATQSTSTNQGRKEIFLETDKIVDDLYYFKDILCVGESRLSKVVTENLLNILIFPILLSLLQLRQSNGSNLSALTSFYIISRLLQVVGGKDMINSVAGALLYPCKSLSAGDFPEGDTADGISHANSFFKHVSDMERIICSVSESEGAKDTSRNHANSHDVSYPGEDNVCMERSGILAYVFSDNHSLFLASLFLLLSLAESKELEYLLASMIGLSETQDLMTYDISTSQMVDGSILGRYMPQILNALLKILASQPPFSVLIQWHTGWFLRKLLSFEGMALDDQNFHLFNTSYEQSRERLRKELDGCWFDHILDTLTNEWTSCKTALEQPSQSKDPLFALELAVCQQTADGNMTASYLAWQMMVDTVKVFVLHLQLKAFIIKGDLLERPFLNSISSPADSGRTHVSDLSTATFGSEVSLGSGISCRIAFSNAGIRDIYLIPAARGVSGKLILAEKHPFRNERGVVIAIAPLAGLSPKIDEDHPSWLHLRIREFDPRYDINKTRGYHLKMSNSAVDGRWTLGFPSSKACEAARLLILEETCKQRSFVESLLSPLLQDDFLGNLLTSESE